MTRLTVISVISPPQFIPEIRMCDGDERFCSFRERLAPQIGNAILGDDYVDISPGCADTGAFIKVRDNPGCLASLSCRMEGQNGSAAFRMRCAADKVRLSSDAAVLF